MYFSGTIQPQAITIATSRLKESFRDETEMVRNRTILTVSLDMNDIPFFRKHKK